MARRGKYRMTPKRRAALRKAQLASAKKRSRGISKKKLAVGATLALAGGAAAFYGGKRIQTGIRKQRAFNELNGKVRLTITRTTPRNTTGLYSESGVRRTGPGALTVAHSSRRSGVRISSFGGVSMGTILGARTASHVPQVDRDSIPLYNPEANKNWPHVDPKNARKKNRKLRKQGMLE